MPDPPAPTGRGAEPATALRRTESTLTAVDVEGGLPRAADVPSKPSEAPPLDIEHLLVQDDPRLWSTARKNGILATIAFCAAGGTVTASIYFPALDSLQAQLHASDSLLALSVSLFILGQGCFPVLWSAISEIKGRRVCYIAAITIYIIATTVCSRASNIGLFIVMRVLQALGSGAVLALGSGTLADIYDAHERGTRLGIFYAIPLVGPALGPLIGGGLTSAGGESGWRLAFYFLIGYGVICLGTMIWLPETFRKERSLAWRLAMQRARAHAKAELLKARGDLPTEAKGNDRPARTTTFLAPTPSQLERSDAPPQPAFSTLNRVKSALSLRSGEDNVKIHLRDVNPFAATGQVLRRKENFIAISFSGLLFASQYCITFTASRTFAAAPYNYDALRVGLVLLCFGAGNFIGSVLGGRYSDYVFNGLKAKNGGKGEPEMRIKSTRLFLLPGPLLLIGYAWAIEKGAPVAAPLVILFFLGLSIIWIYSSLLAYVVDSNPGQSSSAVACNSLFRGVLACIASQAAEPIIDHIHNGWFYTGFGVILLAGEVGILLVGARGRKWREAAQAKEEAKKAELAEKEKEALAA
ncbi:major facilitator superfamily domain-containing protein [Leucosporidium creatinivorum]|uniref:Major facilitator superfamily domain-containing protein n=1 Tax=Leucosporidium creatinivorum TaxID=106004 RepID=A0A1Y2FYP7_9BASI|nr:major facilitator superfamily domain-containing protein [Leucosporidium creatinivorum]